MLISSSFYQGKKVATLSHGEESIFDIIFSMKKPNSRYQLGTALLLSIAVLTPLEFFGAFDSNGSLIAPGMLILQIGAYINGFYFAIYYINSKYMKKFPWLLMVISLAGAFLTPFYEYSGFWIMIIQIMRKVFCGVLAILIYESSSNSKGKSMKKEKITFSE